MSELLFESDQKNQSQGFSIDFKRVLSRAIRFWYVILLFLGAALAIAFYKNRYTQRTYPVSASILIRENQEVSGAEFIFKNAIDPYRNYLNEPYIIRSYPLVERVIKNLNFDVAFYREGYFLTTEAYDYMPVRAMRLDSLSNSTRFIFTLLDKERYTLSRFSENEDAVSKSTFLLGDSIQFEGNRLCIKAIPERSLTSYFGVYFLLTISNPTSVAGSYISRLNVDWAAEGAGIINLSLTGTVPEKEIDFLQELIKEYGYQDLRDKNQTAEQTIAFISSQLIGIKDSLNKVEFQLERFGNNSRLQDMSSDAQRLLVKLEAFEIQKAELLIKQNYYDYLGQYLNKTEVNLDQVILPSSMGINDPVLSNLLSNMVELQVQIKTYISPEKGKNPLVAPKVERINEIRKSVVEALGTLRSTDNIKMTFLKKQLTDTESQLKRLPASERQLIAVQRNYALLENLYVFLMQKLSEAGISKASNTSDIIPVNPPMKGGAISPKPSQNYSFAIIIGLMLPFGIFLIFELINTKVQSKEDIEKMSYIPFLGGVGHNSTDTNLTVKEKPKSGVAESFRALRSNLNYFTGNKGKQVFMVSSSISGEGKTFTTINLATVFALSGKRTLIVGADMRRPKIYEDFGLHNTVGLSTFLSGISEYKDVIQETQIDNLYLVSGGPVPPNPSELLLTDRFESFVNTSLKEFDFVIIDTPPLALVTDAFVISQFVNHTVFVLRQNYSPKEFIRSIDEYYRSGKLKNLSILLNDIYKSGLGYGYGQAYAYQYGYAYGYGYGHKKDGNGYYSD